MLYYGSPKRDRICKDTVLEASLSAPFNLSLLLWDIRCSNHLAYSSLFQWWLSSFDFNSLPRSKLLNFLKSFLVKADLWILVMSWSMERGCLRKIIFVQALLCTVLEFPPVALQHVSFPPANKVVSMHEWLKACILLPRSRKVLYAHDRLSTLCNLHAHFFHSWTINQGTSVRASSSLRASS